MIRPTCPKSRCRECFRRGKVEGIRDCIVSFSRCAKLIATRMGNTVFCAVAVIEVGVVVDVDICCNFDYLII